MKLLRTTIHTLKLELRVEFLLALRTNVHIFKIGVFLRAAFLAALFANQAFANLNLGLDSQVSTSVAEVLLKHFEATAVLGRLVNAGKLRLQFG